MKKLLLLLLMPLAGLSASAQSNGYDMVIELKDGEPITLDADNVEKLTFVERQKPDEPEEPLPEESPDSCAGAAGCSEG